MHIDDYFQIVRETISGCGFIVSSHLSFNARTSHLGYIKAVLYFVDDSELHFREYPHHKHLAPKENAIPTPEPSLSTVLIEVENYLIQKP